MKPVRVAFSGSGFRFPAHVGALMAICDAGYSVLEYAGTSGGSIVAALAASGIPVASLQALTMSQDWSGMLTLSLSAILSRKGYCDGDELLQWITQETGGKTFAELDVDLTIMSSDITNGAPFKWSRDTMPDAPIALAARASASIPFVYSPVVEQGVVHMDGGMANNLPIMKLKQDLVPRIGIQLVSNESPLPPGEHDSILMAPRMLELMLGTNESTQVLMGQVAGATIVQVETGYASGLDRNMSKTIRQRLFVDGYRATQESLIAVQMPAAALVTA